MCLEYEGTKITPVVLIRLNQLYAVNFQPTLLIPVKHLCVMAACDGNGEKQKE